MIIVILGAGRNTHEYGGQHEMLGRKALTAVLRHFPGIVFRKFIEYVSCPNRYILNDFGIRDEGNPCKRIFGTGH